MTFKANELWWISEQYHIHGILSNTFHCWRHPLWIVVPWRNDSIEFYKFVWYTQRLIVELLILIHISVFDIQLEHLFPHPIVYKIPFNIDRKGDSKYSPEHYPIGSWRSGLADEKKITQQVINVTFHTQITYLGSFDHFVLFFCSFYMPHISDFQ